MSTRPTRVILLVMDSVGIGELPDADRYGDRGSDTVGNIHRQVPLAVPWLRRLGLARVAAIGEPSPEPLGAYGRMAERSAGKDSVTGHWELAGLVLERAFPTFPNGFPAPLMRAFEQRIGRATIGNTAASGTAIIEQLGAEHVRTGSPIVYTSADSVFQIAAHEAVIPLEEQYRICEVAADLVVRGMGMGRVIARPFVGEPGQFVRTANRRDFALEPRGRTLLDALTVAGHPVIAIGKIEDLFATRGIARAVHTVSDEDGMDVLEGAMADEPAGLLFVNLVDFDTQYGHRNDVAGYAANLERFDRRLGALIDSLTPEDLLVVTADHGNDPTTASTDHSREYVPVLLFGDAVRSGIDLGTRATFADLGQTLADLFGVPPLAHGTSFLSDVLR
ncbi:MAG: phosphopentomutase [Acidobacteria bacterium SCN 69-37]|nr:MAG: phosphopentomutase [Acidobacteria bacterium SCN 69-37]